MSGLANAAGDVARIVAAPGAARTRDNQAMFSQIIASAKAKPDAETPEGRARTAAEQLVSTALVQPIFKQMRESNNAAPPFAPNQAERTFRSFMDAAIAQKMVHAQHWGLVDRLARGMLKRGGLGAAPKAK
jgi:Rod binding domain-containing protein